MGREIAFSTSNSNPLIARDDTNPAISPYAAIILNFVTLNIHFFDE
jgi:hypothetical protein